MSVHIERDRVTGRTFCGVHWTDAVRLPKPGHDATDDVVTFASWSATPESIQRATCEQCLLRIFMLGDSATIALARMGRKVEVVNAPEQGEAS